MMSANRRRISSFGTRRDRGLRPLSGSPSAHVYTAPGHDVPTTQPGGRWFLVNGSSFSAAHVSGLAALVRQRQRSAGLTLVSDRRRRRHHRRLCDVGARGQGCDCSCGGGPFREREVRALAPASSFRIVPVRLLGSACAAELGATVSVFNDLQFRGYSLSDGRPVATLDFAYDDPSGFYAGASGTGVLVAMVSRRHSGSS